MSQCNSRAHADEHVRRRWSPSPLFSNKTKRDPRLLKPNPPPHRITPAVDTWFSLIASRLSSRARTVRPVALSDEPKGVDHAAGLVVRHLFQVQVRPVDDGQTRIAVVAAAERRPIGFLRHKTVLEEHKNKQKL